MLFDNPYYYIEMFDFEHSVDECRYIAIGKVAMYYLWYLQKKDIIRLIPARLATNAEKSIYYTKTFIIENGQKPTEAQLKEIIKIEVLGHFSSMLKLSALVGIIL